MESNGKESCSFCEKLFSSRCNLFRHLRNVHSVQPEFEGKLICPTCGNNLLTYDDLREHIKNTHNIVLDYDELIFPNFEDFVIWKAQMEKNMKCSYVTRTTSRKLANSSTRYVYVCHRSGFYTSQSTGKKSCKGLMTKRINAHCPSSVILTIESNDVKVQFWKTHYGHQVDIGHLFLSKAERKNIADKLRIGVTFDKILDDIRNSLYGEEISRKHLVDRKDLHNIVRDFDLEKSSMHESDPISVALWVEKMNRLGHSSPVMYYKEQGIEDESGNLNKEDFQLSIMTEFQALMIEKFGSNKICIDSTHGTNPYDFHLVTLLVVDEFGAGCPAAFCVTNRIDCNAITVFFNALKNKCGQIKPSVFMSDDAPAFYNAWQIAMFPAENRILCTWHVDRNWRKNLSKIKGGTEKKALVYKTLRVLLQTIDKTQFHYLLDNTIEQLASDPDTTEFSMYFRKEYATNFSMWATAYRANLGINTNMYLESLHKTLKHFYLQGTKVKRLDKTLNAIMRFSRDKVFDRLIKLCKKTPSTRIAKINESHKRSAEISSLMIKQHDDNEWFVESCSEKNITYKVKKIVPLCSNQCELMCKICNVCIHMFKCTCMDYFVLNNICKHIHACVKMALPCNSKQNISTADEQDELIAIFSAGETAQENSDEEKMICHLKLKYLEKHISSKSYSTETMSKINCLLDKCLNLINDQAENLLVVPKNVKQEPPNKKMKLQKRFFSTKKKSATGNSSISKPSDTERKFITECLESPDYETLNVHSNFDHSYTK